MAMKNCSECGKEISTKAPTCPNCGVKQVKKVGCLQSTLIIIGVFIGIGMLASLGSNSSTKPEAGVSLPSVGKEFVTYDKYQKIENGMTYQQVVEIIGTDGEEQSSNQMEGVAGVMPSIKTVLYAWTNGNGSGMNAMFQNNKLMQKSQFGLN